MSSLEKVLLAIQVTAAIVALFAAYMAWRETR